MDLIEIYISGIIKHQRLKLSKTGQNICLNNMYMYEQEQDKSCQGCQDIFYTNRDYVYTVAIWYQTKQGRRFNDTDIPHYYFTIEFYANYYDQFCENIKSSNNVECAKILLARFIVCLT